MTWYPPVIYIIMREKEDFNHLDDKATVFSSRVLFCVDRHSGDCYRALVTNCKKCEFSGYLLAKWFYFLWIYNHKWNRWDMVDITCFMKNLVKYFVGGGLANLYFYSVVSTVRKREKTWIRSRLQNVKAKTSSHWRNSPSEFHLIKVL